MSAIAYFRDLTFQSSIGFLLRELRKCTSDSLSPAFCCRELDEFGSLIEGEYTYTLIHWPNDREKLFSGQPPDLFISDLYLPSADGDHKPNTEQIEEAASTAREIAHRFHNLYAGGTQAVESIELCKARLRHTMTLITYAYEELKVKIALVWRR